jgi:hypothetical protein
MPEELPGSEAAVRDSSAIFASFSRRLEDALSKLIENA